MKKIIYIIIIITIVVLIFFNTLNSKKEEYDSYDITESVEVKKVEPEKTKNIKVHIAGAIENPGVIELEDDARIMNAIEKAGGVLDEADLAKINLAYKVEDGDKIYIPSIYDKEEVETITEDAGIDILESTKTNNGKININKASRSRTGSIARNWCIYCTKNSKV